MAEFGATIAATTSAAAALAAAASSNERESRWRAYNRNEQRLAEYHPSTYSYRGPRYSSYSYGYGHPMYHHPTYHVHQSGCAQCYYRDFLANSIEKYKSSRAELRETYVWNLRDLSRLHLHSGVLSPSSTPQSPPASQQQQQQQQRQEQRRQSSQQRSSLSAPRILDIPQQQQQKAVKSPEQQEAELDKLYRYYVWRVREVYDKHREQQQRLFGRSYLYWVEPGRVRLGRDGEIICEDEGTRRASGELSGSRSESGSGSPPGSRSRSGEWQRGGDGGRGALRGDREGWARRYTQQPGRRLGNEQQLPASRSEGLDGSGEQEDRSSRKGKQVEGR